MRYQAAPRPYPSTVRLGLLVLTLIALTVISTAGTGYAEQHHQSHHPQLVSKAPPVASTASADSMTITNVSGVVQSDYPLQFGRPFMDNEIPDFPQVLLNGTSVLTQADVKNRYPDGSVKFAVISLVIP
ncbi:MAG TPA: hypothetical protein VGR45_11060, partial [Stellaceae bacterium]|nr:hypothetical protein [Stellaceae bacterium]